MNSLSPAAILVRPLSDSSTDVFSQRIAGLLELSMVLPSKRDLQQLLELFCQAAQDIMSAQYAAVGMSSKSQQPRRFANCGMTEEEVIAVSDAFDTDTGMLNKALAVGKPIKFHDAGDDSWIKKLASGHPLRRQFLIVPVTFGSQTYGWIYLADKPDGGSFNGEDEQFAMTLAAQLAPAYENLALYEEAVQHAGRLELEISERKAAELVAEQVRRQYELILESLGEGIHGIDLAGKIIYENSSAVRMLGYQIDEDLHGKPAHATMHHSKADGTPYPAEQCPIYNSLRDGVVRHIEDEVFWRRDGTSFPVEYTSTPILNEKGDMTWVVVAFRDITERKQAAEAHARLAAIVEFSDDSIISKSMDGTITSWNNGAERLFGYAAREIIGQPISLLIPSGRHDEERGVIQQLQQGKHLTHFETLRRHKDGTLIDVSLTISPIKDATGRIIGASQIAHDITEQKEQQKKIARLSRLYAVLSGINSAIVRIHARNELFQEACRIVVNQGALSMAWVGLVDPDTLEGKAEAWSGCEAGYAESIVLRARARTPESRRPACMAMRERRPIVCNDIRKLMLAPLRDELLERGHQSTAAFPLIVENRVVGVIVLYAGETGFFDEEELKLLNELAGDLAFGLQYIEKEEKLSYLAYYDALTGLPNSMLFHDRLTQFLHGARSEQGMVAAITVNLVNFSQLNDVLGRHVGDALLQQVATRFKTVLREPYTLARIGGDTFAIAIAGLRQGADAASILEKRIFESFEQPFMLEKQEIRVSARGGLALYPADGHDAETLFKYAEMALKKAKLSNERYLYYAPQMNTTIASRMSLENELRAALEAQQFTVYYQPRVDSSSGRIISAEALIRWQHPQRGLVSPQQFIPLAEETGLIVPIGAWIIDAVCAQQAAWIAWHGESIPIAVNLSSIQFKRGVVLQTIQDAMELHRLEPRYIEFELTESVVMDNPEEAIFNLQALKKLGVKLSLDDFGTGYSSLAYLKRFPFDFVKIDRAFVTDITSSKEDAALASAIITMAHGLNLRVIAEGVETEGQIEYLRGQGCDELQGYYFSPPVPAETFAAMLREERQFIFAEDLAEDLYQSPTVESNKA